MPFRYDCCQEKIQLENDLQRLTEFKAEFENLAESSLDDGESVGRDGDGGGDGDGVPGGTPADCGGDGKWKLRAQKLQKYVKWQLAEVENQVQHALVLNDAHLWATFFSGS